MKLPAKIFGQNKIRDGWLCLMYSRDFDYPEIKAAVDKRAERLGIATLVERTIRDKVYKNRGNVKIDKEWEKVQQFKRVQRRIKKAKPTVKDVYDWESLLNDMIDTKKVEHSGEVKGGVQVVQIYLPERKNGSRVETENRLEAIS
jgi:hypothetical protein